MPFIVAIYVYASSQGQLKHSARTQKKLKANVGKLGFHINVYESCPLGGRMPRDKLSFFPFECCS
jgi:hypothetical protein